MRSGFGSWLIRHRGARIGLIAGLLPLPPTSVFSAAIVVAVTIARGWREALVDCVIALVVLSVVTTIAGGAWEQVLPSALPTWILAVWLGSLTGVYGSLALALQVLLVISLIGMAGFVIVVSDPIAFWERILTEFAAQMNEMGVQFAEPDALLALAPVMNGVVAASVVSSSMLALILGAWWAAAAGGPPFREMFTSIRLGYVLGGVAVIAGIAATFLPVQLAGNALLVLGIGFMFQGLSVVHWLVQARGLPWAVLIGVYLPFFMGASIMLVVLFLLAAVGFVDNWYGLRRAVTKDR